MHQPRPHGTFGTDGDEDAAALELLARRLTNAKTLSGVDSLRMSRTLPSGAMAIAQDAGGIFKVIVQKHPMEPEQPLTDGLAKTYVPMLFSGVIKKAIVAPGEGVEIEMTEQTRRRLAQYKPDEELPQKQVKLQRFRVGYNVRCEEFNPKEPGSYFHTQYAAQRPTWYSGAMAEVMQVVGGYGRQVLNELPDDKVERARMVLPQGVADQVAREVGSVRLPGYSGLPDKKGEFQYNYKYINTNGVGFDSEDKPWLLAVNMHGVFAMPLPLVPATTAPAFRAYVEEVGDEELLWILDRFGGMPSGEGVPLNAKDFEAWRRAGVIIKVCDVGDSLRLIPYSSACGWSFNSRGTEGFHTCYDYDDEEGIGFGLAYKMRLRLGTAMSDGKLPTGFHLDDPQDAAAMDAYMSALYRELKDNKARELAIKYKLTRSLPQVLARMESARRFDFDASAEVDYWDNLELAPIATHSGDVSQVGKGWLYNPAKFHFQPQIKFPEPMEGGCLSYDFRPLAEGVKKKNPPRCDTIMFGYYVGDQLKVVKYFWDDRTLKREVENDYDECMTVGSWTRTETATPSGLMGNFYTSDFDDREEAAASKTVTKTVGTDLGYDTKPFFVFDAPFWMPGTLFRRRYFSHHDTTTRTNGYSRSIAVCIPYLCRNAVLHATRSTTAAGSITYTTKLRHVTDPYSYRYWTHDKAMHWAGSLEKMTGKPFPVQANPVWVEIENYIPGACSDFADQGSWIPSLPADYSWLVHPQPGVYPLSGGGGPPPFREYTTTKSTDPKEEHAMQVSIEERPALIHKEPAPAYFVASPDMFGVIFYRDAARLVAGKSKCANTIERSPESPKQRKHWGFTRLADHKSAHHFIGVINE